MALELNQGILWPLRFNIEDWLSKSGVTKDWMGILLLEVGLGLILNNSFDFYRCLTQIQPGFSWLFSRNWIGECLGGEVYSFCKIVFFLIIKLLDREAKYGSPRSGIQRYYWPGKKFGEHDELTQGSN